MCGQGIYCVVPENIHTSPTEGIFSNTSPPLWKFHLSFIHFFKFFGLPEPPTPQETPIPSVGGVWIFSGTAHLKGHMSHHMIKIISSSGGINNNF